jgi:hypothetical protein
MGADILYSDYTNSMNRSSCFSKNDKEGIAPQPLYPTVKSEKIEKQTNKLLSQAGGIAMSILQKNNSRPEAESPDYKENKTSITDKLIAVLAVLPSIFIDNSRHETNIFSKKKVYNVYEEQGNRGNNHEGIIRLIVGLGAAALAAFGIYQAGKAMAQTEDLNEENMAFKERVKQWSVNKNLYAEDEQQKIDGIVNKAIAILERRKANKIFAIACLVTLVVAGVFALVGAIVASSKLMAFGAIVGVGAGLILLGKYAYDRFSRRDEKDAREIDRKLTKVLGPNYTDPIAAEPSAPPLADTL